MSFSLMGLGLPILAMLVLTFLVWLLMLLRRIGYLSASKVNSEEMLTPADVERLLPPEVQAPANNLRNLFELPVIFYVLCFYLLIFAQVDRFYLLCAWVFVLFRYLHSFVHCSYNRVMHRFLVYLIASLALWVMVFRAVFLALL